MLTFAGIALPIAPPELEDRLARIHPVESFLHTEFWNFQGYGLQNLPTPTLPKFPRIKPGVLHWPTGATRPAFFFAVLETDRLNDIRGVVGDPQVAQSLQMSDGRTGKVITAEMLMLPAIPLAQFNQLNDPQKPERDLTDDWLMILTDQRWFWQWKYGDVTDRDSWRELYTNIAANLGVTIADEDVPLVYGTPTEKWLGFNRPMATVLDAAAAQVNQRVVFALDGTIRTVTYTTAKAESDSQMANRHVISGGKFDHDDLGRAVPASLAVFFASGGGGCCAPEPYVVTKVLAEGENFEELFGGSTGIADHTGSLYADAIFDGTNATELNNYAAQAAADWYGWRAPDVDVVFPGVEPWVPTGWEEFAEWTYQVRDDGPFASTLVRRGEFSDLPSGSWEVGDCCEFFVEISGGTDATGYSGTRVVLLGPNTWVAATAPKPLTFTNNIWRAKSNQVSPILPAIASGQVVRVWRSPTYGPVSGVHQYECLPWGSQNKVTVLGVDCLSLDVWGRDLYSTATSPTPPPPPPGPTHTVIAYPTSSPGPGVIRTGTNTRILTRGASGGGTPYGYYVDFGDGTNASGDDVLHVYATAGIFYPTVTVFEVSGGTSGPLLVLGGDGGASLTVLDDPGLAQTLIIYRLEADFVKDNDTLEPVPDLTGWVSSACEYEFEAILWTDNDVTGGVQLSIDGDCTVDEISWQLVSNPTDAVFVRKTALGDTDTFNGSANYFIRLRGSVKVAAAGGGTLGVWYAEASDTADSTLLAGSTFRLQLTQPVPA